MKRPKPRPSENSQILESSVDPIPTTTTSFTVQNEISEETILSSEPSANLLQSQPQVIQEPISQQRVPEENEPQPEDTSIIGKVLS